MANLHNRLKAAVTACAGMSYGTGSRVRFPWHVPGIPQSLVDSKARYIDCSSFTAWCLLNAYNGRISDPSRLYGDLQIFAGRDEWSPILGVVREGLGTEVQAPVQGRWCLAQLWKKDRRYGHAVLVRAEKDGLWVWESKQNRGPGLRATTWDLLTNERDVRLALLNE